MDQQQLQAYLALLGAAMAIGEEIYNGVTHLLGRTLTQEELQQVLALWDENAARAKRNADI